tara:strand:+ start:389 stop:577 length:189 start_codon:yes stop_codon:yes gene_type:complete
MEHTSLSRAAGESYEDYKVRRKKMNEDTKFKLKGELIWESKTDGTYKKNIQRDKSNTAKTSR